MNDPQEDSHHTEDNESEAGEPHDSRARLVPPLLAWLPTALGRPGTGRARVRPADLRVARLEKSKRRKRTRRKRRLTALAAVASILAGVSIVAGSVFFASVELPGELDDQLSQNSTVYYSDGKTEMATIGAQKRTSVSLDEIPNHLEWALIGTEDKQFYEHEGVDIWGVLRALWNNVSGGSTQGASTLTQQYVGQVAEIRGDGSYLRKAREAVMAMKMEDHYGKKSILNHYLNLVYFGRGAYGVEAAAHAFFDKPVKDLDVAESALLVAQIKSPSGAYDPGDPLGLGKKEVEGNAEGRWFYVLDQLVKIGKLKESKRDKITKLPDTVDPSSIIEARVDTPTGHISHGYVLDELREAGISQEKVLRGGFRITTTVDTKLQDAAAKAAKRATASGDEDAAVVAVEPNTGRVLAYYGGPSGAEADLAGSDLPHPPGTTFNVVPALTALEHGASPSSKWDGSSPRKVDYRDEPIVNIGGKDEPKASLTDVVSKKLSTAADDITEEFGPEAVADTANRLGVTRLRQPATEDSEPKWWDPGDAEAEWTGGVGIGEYGMSVADSATMYATIAAGGTRATTHIIEKVTDADGETVYKPKDSAKRAVDGTAVGDLTMMLAYGVVPPTDDAGYLDVMATNASATSYTGFSPALSLAVWAGDDKHEGDGSSVKDTTAQKIWERVAATGVERFPTTKSDAGLEGSEDDLKEEPSTSAPDPGD